jgi:hypothetical protein
MLTIVRWINDIAMGKWVRFKRVQKTDGKSMEKQYNIIKIIKYLWW